MKKGSKTYNSIRNTIWGVLYRLVTQLMPFVIRTIIILSLGIEFAGLSSLFTSLLVVLSFAELGFSNAIVYLMYRPIANNQQKEVCALLNLFRKIYRIVGLVILAIGICLYPFIPYLIKGAYPTAINLHILYSIYIINCVLSYFLYAYKSSILYASQRRDIESIISVSVMMLIYTCQILVLLLTKNYYFYIVLLPISTILINLLIGFVTHRFYPWAKCYGQVTEEIRANIKSKVFSLFGHKLGFTVRASSTTIIISSFLGLSAVALYNNYYLVINAAATLLGVFYQSILPSIGNSTIKYSKDKNYNDFINLSLLNTFMIGISTSLFLCIFQPFMKMWLGTEYLLPFKTVLYIVISFYFLQVRYIVLNYKDAIGMWNKDAIRPYIEITINLILSIYLVKKIGIDGVLLGTIITYILISIPWETYVLHKYYFEKSVYIYYLKQTKYLITNITCCYLCIYACQVSNYHNVYLNLIKNIIICLFVTCFIFHLLFRKNDEYKYFKYRVFKH